VGVASFGSYRVLYCQFLSFTGAQIGLLAGTTPATIMNNKIEGKVVVILSMDTLAQKESVGSKHII
jgi:hypothetical protein